MYPKHTTDIRPLRPTDGYTSLLIEEEGGVAQEIVSEENGVLISTILRQYFMSLKVLGKWKRWGKSLDSKFLSIQTNLQKNHKHTFHDASPTTPDSSLLLHHHHHDQYPAIANVVSKRDTPTTTITDTTHSTVPEDPDADEDEDDGPMYDSRVPIQFTEFQKEVIRKVMRKWWRVAGLKGASNPCDELDGGEFQVNWTKAIAPRLEGRIREVGAGVGAA